MANIGALIPYRRAASADFQDNAARNFQPLSSFAASSAK